MRRWSSRLIAILCGFLMTNIDAQVTSGKPGEQYFKSWASYHIPRRPVDPITYSATEPLESFYLAIYDASGKLAKFTKYLREMDPAGRLSVEAKHPARKAIYFQAVPDAHGNLRPGNELPYSETTGLSVYFKGITDSTGKSVELELVHVAIFFSDEYSYWPNGKLKDYVSRGEDGMVIRRSYDSSGKELPQRK